MQPTTANSVLGVFNAMVPKEGPKCIPLQVNFSQGNSQRVDLTTQQQQGKISFFQSIFVDNSQNSVAIQIENPTAQCTLIVPPSSQGILPLFLGNPPYLNVTTSTDLIIPIFLFNVPLPAQVWSVAGEGGFTFDGANLLVSDTALEALIANLGGGNALNVNVVHSVSGGGGGAGANNAANILSVSSGGGGDYDYGTNSGDGNYLYVTGLNILVTGDAAQTGGAGRAFIEIIFASNGEVVWEGECYIPVAALNGAGQTLVSISFPSPLKSPNIGDELKFSSGGTGLNSGLFRINAYGFIAA